MLNEIIDLVARRRGYKSPEEVGRAVEEAKSATAEEVKAAASTQMDTQLLSAVMSALNFGVAPEKSYHDLVGAYRGWIYTAVDKIAKTGATLPLRLKVYRRKNGQKVLDTAGIRMKVKAIGTAGERKYVLKDMGLVEEEIYEHPFLDLMRTPNGIMSRMVLWYETLLRMEVGGSCGWYVVKNRLGLPGEIWPLPLTSTATLAPRVSPDVRILEWIYLDGATRKTFAPDDIVMFKYPNPKNPFLGFSPLMAQTYPYDIDLFLMQQQRSLFQNKGIPGIHLHTDSPFTKEQAKEIRDQVTEQWGSATQSGRPLITHSGLKADKSGWSNKESLVAEVSKDVRERLITSYDLSEGKLGLVTDVNRANMDALNDTFILECIKPKCMLIEEQIESFLLPRWDRGLFCDFELPDVGDREGERAENEMLLGSYVVTINEVRAKKGMDPVSWGEKPWFSFGVTQDPEALSEPIPPPPAKEGEGGEGEEKASAASRTRRWRQFISRQAPWEKMVTSQMKGYFRNLGTEVIGRLNQFGPRVEAQYAGWSRKAVQEHIAKKGVGDDINIVKKAEAARLVLLVKPPVAALVEEGGKRILRELGVDIAFNVNDPKVAKWLGSRMDMFSQEVAGTTFDDIRAILRQGFSDGKPLSVIAGTLRETFDSYDKYRAPLIARTKTIAASNKADMLAIRQAGIEDMVVKTWITAGDEDVRPTHVQAGIEYADGIPIDDLFTVGDDEMDAPGNGSDPAEVINCRCCEGIEKANSAAFEGVSRKEPGNGKGDVNVFVRVDAAKPQNKKIKMRRDSDGNIVGDMIEEEK